MPTCPKCGSKRVSRYTPHGLSCDDCGHDDRSDEFTKASDAKAAGILEAACFVHGRADKLREQGGFRTVRWANVHVARLLDSLADDLKALATVRKDEQK